MNEQLATRLEAPLRQRLRVYAAVNRRTVTEVVTAALDGYLPPMEDMFAPCLVSPGSNGGPGE